ncbi:MAG: hypothetical protein FWD02_00375 [Bacteroidales bacterium]|nr:hypothetical protein [Bacteroidales bacterium]
MKKNAINYLILMAMMFAITSCSDEGYYNRDNLDTTWRLGSPRSGDVYIVGSIRNPDPHRGGEAAAIWKNGVIQHLTDWKQGGQTAATSVFVSGNDVFVVGHEEEIKGLGTGIARLWKNGIAQYLPDSESRGGWRTSANSVLVYNNDVFVAGHTIVVDTVMFVFESGTVPIARYSRIPTLWKNGVTQHLTDTSNRGTATSVFVANGNVYVAGTVEKANVGTVATVWKNGVMQHLTEFRSAANSVFVHENEVFVVGHVREFATLWRSGVENLIYGTPSTSATSVFVSNGDVYVAGGFMHGSSSIGFHPRFWKNSIVQDLPFNRINDGRTRSVFVVGNDVYVIGSEENAFVNARLWRNGVVQSPFNSYNSPNIEIRSIFVVE